MAMYNTQLGQSRPSGTTAASIYSPAASTQTIVSHVIIANTSGAAATFRLFHDDDGTTYDETTALAWDVAIAADETVTFDTAIAMADSSGNLAVRTDTADALTFTAYGMELT